MQREDLFVRYVRENLKDIFDQAVKNCMPRILRDQEKIIIDAIQKYYSVPKKFYKRTKSLFEVYEITEDGFDFGPEHMEQKHRVGNEYIYEKMFVEGYHGGSSGMPGTPDSKKNPKPWDMAYRKPVRIFGESNIKAYSLWSNTAPRVSDPSPYELIKQGFEEYNTIGSDMVIMEVIKIVKSIRKRVMS